MAWCVPWGFQRRSAPAFAIFTHAIYSVAALQTEYSLWSRDFKDGILKTCCKGEIDFVQCTRLESVHCLTGTNKTLNGKSGSSSTILTKAR